MLNRILKISTVFALAIFATLLTSCDKETVLSDELVQNFVNESVEAVERSGNVGRTGCFEFVFPISITFPDGSTASVEDYETLRSTVKDWKENNPDAEEKPTLAYPLEVIGEDGAVVSIDSQDALKELKQTCRRNGKKNHGKKDRCFEMVFPLSITFPDGTTTAYDDRMALKTAVRAWKAANPDAEERPTLAFPLEITLEDGTTVTISDAEALQAQKESCAGN